MDSSLLLSSGEFADMCCVSRELLIHYDKIGILKPQVTAENGYRYYSLRQLYLFDVIRFFVDTGMSTKEIKDYLDNRSTELFLDTALTSITKMKRQRDILDARIDMMKNMRYLTQRGLHFPKDKPRLSYWDETWLITTDVEDEKLAKTQHVYAQAVSRHSDFCRNSAQVSKFPLGRIVEISDTDDPESFTYTKIMTWINKPDNPSLFRDRIEFKPRGNYAVILHQGGTSNIAKSYRKLFDFMQEEGFEMIGPIYELDMHSYLMSDSTEDYLVHISVLVNTE